MCVSPPAPAAACPPGCGLHPCPHLPPPPGCSVAYGRVEVCEGGWCEVDLFIQDQEGARVTDKWVGGRSGGWVQAAAMVKQATQPLSTLCCKPVPLRPPSPSPHTTQPQRVAGGADAARAHRGGPARAHRPARRL